MNFGRMGASFGSMGRSTPGGSAVPANARQLEDGTYRILEDGTYRVLES